MKAKSSGALNKYFRIIVPLCFLSTNLFAQTQGIMGWVADSASNKVISGAHAILTRPSDGLSLTSATGSKGGFYFNPPAGTTYALHISFVGYGPFITEDRVYWWIGRPGYNQDLQK